MAGFYCGVDTESQALRFDERILDWNSPMAMHQTSLTMAPMDASIADSRDTPVGSSLR